LFNLNCNNVCRMTICFVEIAMQLHMHFLYIAFIKASTVHIRRLGDNDVITVMEANCIEKIRQETPHPSISRLTGQWTSRRCGEVEPRNLSTPTLPLSLSRKPSSVVNATPLLRELSYDKRLVWKILTPSLSTPRRRETTQLLRSNDLKWPSETADKCKQITQPVGLCCQVARSSY
jgi:hypothetical protein